MQQFAIVESAPQNMVYQPRKVLLPLIWAIKRVMLYPTSLWEWMKLCSTQTFLSVFDQVWHDKEKLTDVDGSLGAIHEHRLSETRRNRSIFSCFHNLFNEFL